MEEFKWKDRNGLTYNDFLRMVSVNGNRLKQVFPTKWRDYRMCYRAVMNCSNSLNYVPREIKTKVLSDILRNDPEKIRSIPCDVKLIGTTYRKGRKIQRVIERFSEEACIAAVESNPMILKYIPSDSQTFDVCKCAIMGDPKAIQFVKITDVEEVVYLRKLAVAADYSVLQFMSFKYNAHANLDVARIALLNSAHALKYIPKELHQELNKEIVEALRKEPGALQYAAPWLKGKLNKELMND